MARWRSVELFFATRDFFGECPWRSGPIAVTFFSVSLAPSFVDATSTYGIVFAKRSLS
jgi:hypothetical protein